MAPSNKIHVQRTFTSQVHARAGRTLAPMNLRRLCGIVAVTVVFFIGWFCFLFAPSVILRVFGAICLSAVLWLGCVTSFRKGWIKENGQLVFRSEHPIRFRMSLMACSVLCVLFSLLMMLAAAGKLPFNGP